MIQELGIMLCKEREKIGEKQKSVAQGIISISELSKLELAISSNEYECISYRAEIEDSIAEWDYERLTELIAGYDACNDKSVRSIDNTRPHCMR